MTRHPHRRAALPGSFRSLALSLLVLPLLGLACTGSSPPATDGATREARAADAAAPPVAPPADEDLMPAEIATVGWDALTDGPLVLLRELTTGRVVPIWVGLAEAQAIGRGLHEIAMPRPMTHDLMTDLLGKLDATLEEVIVHSLAGSTYLGALKLRVDGRKQPLWVDTRPSDGLALAVRTGAAIRIHRRVVEQTPAYDFLAPEEGEQVVSALGLTVVAPTAALREEFALPDRPGIVVTRVSGEAERAGLRRGDLLLAAGERPLEKPLDLLDAAAAAPPGEAVTLRYWRDGEEGSAEVVPGRSPSDPRKLETA